MAPGAAAEGLPPGGRAPAARDGGGEAPGVLVAAADQRVAAPGVPNEAGMQVSAETIYRTLYVRRGRARPAAWSSGNPIRSRSLWYRGSDRSDANAGWTLT